MSLRLLDSARFTGPAFPADYVRDELEADLQRRKLLPKASGQQVAALQESWNSYRRKLRELVTLGGAIRVRNHVVEPLLPRLGYDRLETADEVETREGPERGGILFVAANGAKLRLWVADFGEDLDAPARRGSAYRYSHVKIAQRVLLATGERVGLMTNGQELRILISDPARIDSQVEIDIDPQWKRSREAPDTYRLLLALASPSGVAAIPELLEKARLRQSLVTRELRLQARQAVERFVQAVLDHPDNQQRLAALADKPKLAHDLWHEGLVVVYRLLFILKLESTDDPARSFSFASTSLWRNTFSPSVALTRRFGELPLPWAVLEGAETGRLLEDAIRQLFGMFERGLECTELTVKPLCGALFGEQSTPLVSHLRWGETAVAHLLDKLLWTPRRRGSATRERIHYGSLNVEDLGRVYEALLELEPGIAEQAMCRLRRAKLEVVVPLAQGERYRPVSPVVEEGLFEPAPADDKEEEDAEDEKEGTTSRGKKTKVEWIEEIPSRDFYLRVGLGRKATGSYYTPDSFVKFLVQETCGKLVLERSPKDDPSPAAILALKILDPAMGSGHFLVEACRFLGEKLYEACRLCDELAVEADQRATSAKTDPERDEAMLAANSYRQRIIDLPDSRDELMQYLPSRAPEGEESGLSQMKAEALCRRLVAVHCLYGADKNALAVELAKLSLWIESHSEGLPLTFLDHRLAHGDSLTGPFLDHLSTLPCSGQQMKDMFTTGLHARLSQALNDALARFRLLDSSIGLDMSDIEAKRAAKAELDRIMAPFRVVAAAWTGGAMLGLPQGDESAFVRLLQAVANGEALPLRDEARLRDMIASGLGLASLPTSWEALLPLVADATSSERALDYDFAFADVMFPHGQVERRGGFDAVLGNPPWSKMNLEEPAFMGSFDLRFLEASTTGERRTLEEEHKDSAAWTAWKLASRREESYLSCLAKLHPIVFAGIGSGFGGGDVDIFAMFVERAATWLKRGGILGMVIPSGFHVSKSLVGLRDSILTDWTLTSYFCYENCRKLFDIHGSWKFTPAVALKELPPTDHAFLAQFYLPDDSWLFSEHRTPPSYAYPTELIKRMDPATLIFQEFQSDKDLLTAETVFISSMPFEKHCELTSIHLRRELDATDDRGRINYGRHPRRWRDTGGVGLIHHLPGTMHQYTDLWAGADTALVPYTKLHNKKAVLRLARYYRAAYRTQARATDERTSIFTVLPPGTTATNSLRLEGSPAERPNHAALCLVAVCNSFAFDWALRLRVGSKTVSKFIMEGTPFPASVPGSAFLGHACLRLVSNHEDFLPLWREQLGQHWREQTPEVTWPVIAREDARWQVRAEIDAVVASAYGLTRSQYEHVLSTFSHRSYPRAPELCLAAFDELGSLGICEFVKKYDPYWDIPPIEAQPEPVVDIPIPEDEDRPVVREGRLDFGPGTQEDSP